MGYMGLDSWIDSDNAADTFCDVCDAIAKILKKRLRDKAGDNEWNTSGHVDVGLIFEALFPEAEYAGANEDLAVVAEKAKKLLDKDLEYMKKHKVGDAMHKGAYKRLSKHLGKFIKNNSD